VTKGRVLEFAAEIANNHNLSLVDLSQQSSQCRLITGLSQSKQVRVCNMWSMYLDKVNQKESNPISQGCLHIFNHLMSEYLNDVNGLESHPFIPPQRRSGLAKGHWYQNQFSLNLPSTVALMTCLPSMLL
jgi:hypothetical protein